MKAGDPVRQVGVGLGKVPGPNMLATDKTTSIFFDIRHVPPGIVPGASLPQLLATYVDDPQTGLRGAMASNPVSVLFTNLRIDGVTNMCDGSVRVDFHFFSAMPQPPSSSRAVATKGVSGN